MWQDVDVQLDVDYEDEVLDVELHQDVDHEQEKLWVD